MKMRQVCIFVCVFIFITALNNIVVCAYEQGGDIKVGDYVFFGRFFTNDFEHGNQPVRNSEVYYEGTSLGNKIMWGTEKYFAITSDDGSYSKLKLSWAIRPGYYYWLDLGALKWTVIDIKDNIATLICTEMSENNVFEIPYDESYENGINLKNSAVSWDKSIVRSFLNSYDADSNFMNIDYSKYGFLSIAFSEDEQNAIKEKEITINSEIICDKVFLLSCDEVKKYINRNIKIDENVINQHSTELEFLTRDCNSKEVYSFSTDGEIHRYNSDDLWFLNMAPVIYVDMSKLKLSNHEFSAINISDWAKDEIRESLEKNIVPVSLQSNYQKNITRKEFCSLIMHLYAKSTGKNIDIMCESPFEDVNNIYVTAAYNMKIVSGTEENKFMPDKNITRQEAAVMLDNLASVMNVDTNDNSMNVEKFADEDMFADWARAAIYKTTNIKSGDTFVLIGIGDRKFSPLSNYTREQAIVSMLRLFNCTEDNKTENNNKYTKKEDIGCNVYLFENSKGMTGAINASGDIIVRPEYKRPTSGSIFAVNNIFTLSDENNNYFVFDTNGKLIKKLHYDKTGMDSDSEKVINTWYNITAVSGSNLVIEEQLEDIDSKSHTNQMCFIKRLVSEYTGENNIYDIIAVSNGQFIARNKDNSYPCVLHLDGCKRFETEEDELHYIDRGFYYGYHQQDDEYIITVYNASGDWIEHGIKEKVIEGVDLDLKENFEIDPENRRITLNTKTNNIDVKY